MDSIRLGRVRNPHPPYPLPSKSMTEIPYTKTEDLLFTDIRFLSSMNTLMNNELVKTTKETVAFFTFKLLDV
jgi:hypothetical protein